MDIIDKLKKELEQSILAKLRSGESLTQAERQAVLRMCEAYLKHKREAESSDPRQKRPL